MDLKEESNGATECCRKKCVNEKCVNETENMEINSKVSNFNFGVNMDSADASNSSESVILDFEQERKQIPFSSEEVTLDNGYQGQPDGVYQNKVYDTVPINPQERECAKKADQVNIDTKSNSDTESIASSRPPTQIDHIVQTEEDLKTYDSNDDIPSEISDEFIDLNQVDSSHGIQVDHNIEEKILCLPLKNELQIENENSIAVSEAELDLGKELSLFQSPAISENNNRDSTVLSSEKLENKEEPSGRYKGNAYSSMVCRKDGNDKEPKQAINNDEKCDSVYFQEAIVIKFDKDTCHQLEGLPLNDVCNENNVDSVRDSSTELRTVDMITEAQYAFVSDELTLNASNEKVVNFVSDTENGETTCNKTSGFIVETDDETQVMKKDNVNYAFQSEQSSPHFSGYKRFSHEIDSLTDRPEYSKDNSVNHCSRDHDVTSCTLSPDCKKPLVTGLKKVTSVDLEDEKTGAADTTEHQSTDTEEILKIKGELTGHFKEVEHNAKIPAIGSPTSDVNKETLESKLNVADDYNDNINTMKSCLRKVPHELERSVHFSSPLANYNEYSDSLLDSLPSTQELPDSGSWSDTDDTSLYEEHFDNIDEDLKKNQDHSVKVAFMTEPDVKENENSLIDSETAKEEQSKSNNLSNTDVILPESSGIENVQSILSLSPCNGPPKKDIYAAGENPTDNPVVDIKTSYEISPDKCNLWQAESHVPDNSTEHKSGDVDNDAMYPDGLKKKVFGNTCTNRDEIMLEQEMLETLDASLNCSSNDDNYNVNSTETGKETKLLITSDDQIPGLEENKTLSDGTSTSDENSVPTLHSDEPDSKKKYGETKEKPAEMGVMDWKTITIPLENLESSVQLTKVSNEDVLLKPNIDQVAGETDTKIAGCSSTKELFNDKPDNFIGKDDTACQFFEHSFQENVGESVIDSVKVVENMPEAKTNSINKSVLLQIGTEIFEKEYLNRNEEPPVLFEMNQNVNCGKDKKENGSDQLCESTTAAGLLSQPSGNSELFLDCSSSKPAECTRAIDFRNNAREDKNDSVESNDVNSHNKYEYVSNMKEETSENMQKRKLPVDEEPFSRKKIIITADHLSESTEIEFDHTVPVMDYNTTTVCQPKTIMDLENSKHSLQDVGHENVCKLDVCSSKEEAMQLESSSLHQVVKEPSHMRNVSYENQMDFNVSSDISPKTNLHVLSHHESQKIVLMDCTMGAEFIPNYTEPNLLDCKFGDKCRQGGTNHSTDSSLKVQEVPLSCEASLNDERAETGHLPNQFPQQQTISLLSDNTSEERLMQEALVNTNPIPAYDSKPSADCGVPGTMNGEIPPYHQPNLSVVDYRSTTDCKPVDTRQLDKPSVNPTTKPIEDCEVPDDEIPAETIPSQETSLYEDTYGKTVYSCDADLLEKGGNPVCQNLDDYCTTTRYTKKIEDTIPVTKIFYQPKPCKKSMRLGLSKRQRVRALHPRKKDFT